MLSLKDYGSSDDEDGPSENTQSVPPETPTVNSINIQELSVKFAVNAAPDVLPPVSFKILLNYRKVYLPNK